MGAAESSEFLRQSREIARELGRGWSRDRVPEVPGTNHFTILDELTQPQSPLSKRVSAMAQRVQAG